MVRNVRTLVFEDISPLSEQFLDLMGIKLSVRQAFYLSASLLLGYGVSLLIRGLLNKAFVIMLFFAFGAMLSAIKIKTLTPEQMLLYMIAMPKPKAEKKKEKPVEPVQEKRLDLPTQSIDDMQPVKVVGTLFGANGMPVANKAFTVYVNGREYTRGVTDEYGNYMVFFMPPSFGAFKIEIQPAGSEEKDVIQVNVKQPAR